MQRTETDLRGMKGKEVMGYPRGTTQEDEGEGGDGVSKRNNTEDSGEADDGVPRRNNTGHRKYPQSEAGLFLGASSSKS